MKKYIFILLITISCNLVSFSANQDYIGYFRGINEAELYIIKQDYHNSLDIYSELFYNYSNISFKDLNNACICALKQEQYEQALSYAKELILHGYETKDFNKEPFNDEAHINSFKKPLLSVYPYYREQYLQSLNPNTRKIIYEWFREDQRAASGSEPRSSTDSTFQQLSNKLSDLIEKNGFPAIFLNKDTMSGKLQVMLRHYCGLENRKKIHSEDGSNNDISRIHKIMNQALHDGLVSPSLYVHITTYWETENPYGKLAINIDFDKEEIVPFYKNTSEKEIEIINQNRDKIGLPVMTQMVEDIINSPKYKNYPFTKIEEAVLNCDSCKTMRQYMSIITGIYHENMEKKDVPTDNFLLSIEIANQITETYFSKGEMFSIINKRIRERGGLPQEKDKKQ